ncbi:hypothetical protein CC78DRAFT_172115 [Lojkania enalia]|uniref:Secreted protein n=1 Tax=Lojkania enalia TaxID=147567 RepID=A0A9P4KDA3_9PLEO|nr:hypothetical protein CC78DRAFT_172115 [Didymosphaeria enalia]
MSRLICKFLFMSQPMLKLNLALLIMHLRPSNAYPFQILCPTVAARPHPRCCTRCTEAQRRPSLTPSPRSCPIGCVNWSSPVQAYDMSNNQPRSFHPQIAVTPCGYLVGRHPSKHNRERVSFRRASGATIAGSI